MAREYPIVLAHGICRFDHLMSVTFEMDNGGSDQLHYFRKIRSTLRTRGFDVWHANVSWGAGVEKRARDLRERIVQITQDFSLAPKVHIIAHSMGGLDARHMITELGMAPRVATLTTIGTPHLGSCLADGGGASMEFLIESARYVGLDMTGLRDLCTTRCHEYNKRVESEERNNGVGYRAFAGARPLARMFLPFRLTQPMIEAREGANDGLVAESSAAWRDDVYARTLDAHHLNQMGWSPLSDGLFESDREAVEAAMRELYVEIAEGL